MMQDFIHGLKDRDLPEPVLEQARRMTLDLIGVAAAGSQTKLSKIINNHAVRQFGGNQAKLLCDGRTASAAGAALAGGMTIDAFDAHDGHPECKGHAGAGVFPALMALWQAERPEGDFYATLIMSYEIAIRVGIAQHRTCPDYHTSGAWNALGAAAIGSRLLGQTEAQTREALGIAEYHGPRSQMMRCIDFPTMLKDGSGWGAMTGVSAAYLAQDGFTGAPALTCESEEVADLWGDLGARWRVMEQYFKPVPVCRWAQPAMQAAEELVASSGWDASSVDKITITTFHESLRLQGYRPQNTEEAQYALVYPVAAYLARGKLGPEELEDQALSDPAILAVADKIQVIEDEFCNANFPQTRYSKVRFERDKDMVETGYVKAQGDADTPLSNEVLIAKFQTNAAAHWDQEQRQAILKMLPLSQNDNLDVSALIALIATSR